MWVQIRLFATQAIIPPHIQSKTNEPLCDTLWALHVVAAGSEQGEWVLGPRFLVSEGECGLWLS